MFIYHPRQAHIQIDVLLWLIQRCINTDDSPINSVQVNIPAESGEMGILANHVPSIEQLKPGLVEIIEESGGSKQFFRASTPTPPPEKQVRRRQTSDGELTNRLE